MRRLAFLTLFTAACLPGFDTTDPDEPIDPPIEEPPAPDTSVAVQIRAAGLGVSGIPVVFQGPDDSVLAELVTDATGVVSTDMPDGGSVTVVSRELDEGGTTRVTAYTYTGVKPGDLLDLTNPRRTGQAPITVRISVPLPILDPDDDPDTEPTSGAYAVITPCGAAAGVAPTIEITLDGCGAETDFFVIDETAGSFLAHRAISPTIDLSQEAVRGNLETTLAILNLPDTATVTVEKRLLTDGFLMYTSPPVPANVPTLVPDIGATIADQLVVATVNSQVGSRRVASHSIYSNDTTGVDLVDTVLPVIQTIDFDGSAVMWTEQALGTRDFAVATLVEGSLTRMIAGGTDAALHIPALPSTYAVSFTPDAQVSVALGKATGGYDAVRGNLLNGNLVDAAPMNGQIVVGEAVAR